MPRPPSLRTTASSSSLTSSLTNTVLRFLIFGTVRYVSRYSSSETLRCLPLVLLLTGSSGSGGVSFLLASPDASSATSPDGIIDSVTEASVPADSPGPGYIMSLSHHSSWPAPGLRPFFLSAVSDTAIFFPFVFSVGSLFIVHGF